MALYTRPELCKILNITDAYLTTYITRGKINLTYKQGKSYVDDRDSSNAYFIQKRLNKMSIGQEPSADVVDQPVHVTSKPIEEPKVTIPEPVITVEEPVIEVAVEPPAHNEPEKRKQRNPHRLPINYGREESEAISARLGVQAFENRRKSNEGNDFVDLKLEKERRTVEKLEQEIKKLELSNSKTQGNFVEIEAIKSLIVLLSESIHTAWETGMEGFILKFAAKNQLSREEMLVMKKDINETSNAAKDTAIEQAKKQLRRLQSEAANKRGVGERL